MNEFIQAQRSVTFFLVLNYCYDTFIFMGNGLRQTLSSAKEKPWGLPPPFNLRSYYQAWSSLHTVNYSVVNRD